LDSLAQLPLELEELILKRNRELALAEWREKMKPVFFHIKNYEWDWARWRLRFYMNERYGFEDFLVAL
jgi:hypothetical protein